MKRKYFRLVLLYAALIVVAVFLAFPFYWVVTSSVKSREGINMNPPAFYPARTQKVDFNLPARNKILSDGEKKWFLLIESENLLSNSDSSGAYYLRVDGNLPSQQVVWFPSGKLLQKVENEKEIQFTKIPVYENSETGEDFISVARMVRKKEGGYEELLFTMPAEPAPRPEIRLMSGIRYREHREFYARWENYAETLEGPEATYSSDSTGFLAFMKNSFIISLLAILGQIISSSFVAYGFARLKFRGREFWFVVLLATLMIPAQVTLIPMFSIYKSLGWIDTFLPLIVPHFTAGAFNVFLLRQYMLTLPKELDESAIIDGCGIFRTYFNIILPNIIPALIVVGLFTFVATWQDVMGPLIYLDSPELRTVPLGLEYFRSPYTDNNHLIMTGATLSMLPIAVLFIFFQRYIMSGIATTGLKG